MFDANNSKSLKSISGVSLDISSIYFKVEPSDFYTYGTVYYRNWNLCRSEYQNYRLLCLVSRYEITASNFKAISLSKGDSIVCSGNVLDNDHYSFSYNNYWGCAIMGKNNYNYYTGLYKAVKTYNSVVIISDLSMSLPYSERALIGRVKYKNWDTCERDSTKLSLRCVVDKSYIYSTDYTSSTATKYKVNCSGNVIYHEFVGSNNDYYGCALINNYNVIYDYESTKYDSYFIDISSLKVVNHTKYRTISGNVYYPTFPSCDYDFFKLVCVFTKKNPEMDDFLNKNNELLDANCSKTYVAMNVYDQQGQILSCGVIDKNRSHLFVYDIMNSEFHARISLKDLERKNNRNESVSHIVGNIEFKNWDNCNKERLKYYLKCSGSYNELTRPDIVKGKKEDIDCDGNKIDVVITGEGKYVYFGCGIFSSGGITLFTYDIKKIKIKIYLGLVFKMLGFSILADILPIFILLCCILGH